MKVGSLISCCTQGACDDDRILLFFEASLGDSSGAERDMRTRGSKCRRRRRRSVREKKRRRMIRRIE
jgi:hypothetical protein